MNELETFIGPNGLPTQIFNGKVYHLYPYDPRYFQRGSHQRLHVAVWTFYNEGKPPKKHHVHHKDENKHNNHPDNLVLIPSGEHMRLHTTKRKKENPEWFQSLAKKGQDGAAKWSKTAEGYAFRRAHADKVLAKYYEHLHKREVKKICEQCAKQYLTTNICTEQSRFCSNNCKSMWRRKAGIDDEPRKCIKCGNEFLYNKYATKKYCFDCTPKKYRRE